MFVYILIFILILLCFIHFLLNYNERARLIKKIPGPKDAFLVGNALEIIVSPVELMELGRQYSRQWKDIYRFWSYPFGVVNIYNPDDIETVISTTKYNDKSLIYEFLKPWLRNGLLVNNGDGWHQRRKLLTPAFHFNILKQFFGILEENSQRLVDILSNKNEPVDITPVLSEFTLYSICETAMGTQLNKDCTSESGSYKQAIYGLGSTLLYRFLRLYLYPNGIFNMSSTGRNMQKHINVIQNFTKKVIKDRREYVEKHNITFSDDLDDDNVVYKKRKTAMLDLLLIAERDGLIDEKGIQEEVDTFMFEGHDTTASSLTFSLLEIANNKNVQDKIHSELQEIFGDSSRRPTVDDLAKMRYLELCIKESLRLYPPVHFISRKINDTVTLSGYTIPPGSICHIHILDLHRSPRLYENPLVFDPDRFLPENYHKRHPYAYIPFSAGPRNCIGQKFAMMEMKLAISEIIRKFELEPVTRRDDIQFTADLVLRSAKPIYINFYERKSA